MKKKLSQLSEVDLREVWEHEGRDFTTWLSQQENLDLLGKEIGVDIKLVQTEASVGRFTVDILAQEESSGRKVIIENQLEDTNHDHLGKIITYASGYDAEIIIWIVKNVREEHQKALDWLNEHTDEKINFFLIKIELWRIEGSDPAPKFEIIVSPNEWAKAIKESPASGELTETNVKYLEFWTQFRNYVRQKDNKIRLQTPRAQHYYDVSIGSSDAHMDLTLNSRENLVRCGIYIPNNKDLFKFLQSHQSDIEKEINGKLDWVDAQVASRILLKKEVGDVFDPNQADQNYAWLYEKMLLFQKVFGEYLREFKK